MPETSYDLVVVGAGINGAAIAREAAAQGLGVLLLDQADLGGGTTSASTRLIHGGLRYLEHGELGLVRESLREREILLECAPHLVEPLGLFIPVYVGGRRARWQIGIGLQLYDWLAVGRSLPGHRMLSRDELLAQVPGLTSDGLAGGAFYYDAQVQFPERLVVENVLDAVEHGARFMSYTRATAVSIADGAVRGVDWRDRHGAAGRASARLVVNAAGPWVDRVLATLGSGSATGARGRSGESEEAHPRLIGGTKGSHLIVEGFRGAPDAALYTEAASDGRPFFVIPWNGMYLIGTTDLRYSGDPGEATISDAEFGYLVEETERLFPASGGVAPHVLYTQSGVRPLPYEPGKAEGAVTRRHLIHAHEAARGLYSVIGGKLTTHRALAEQMLERLRRDHDLGDRRGHAGNRPLPGAAPPAVRDALLEELGSSFGAAEAQRLWCTYGGRAERLLELIREEPELGERAHKSLPLPAELVHALESEWAATLIDILQRRCMLGLGPDFGLAAARFAAETLRRLSVWDESRAEQELEAYLTHARRFRVRALQE
ncbi:MAG TPA: glycerol-3-phosphate dehydrogenase/oxidase [Gammaproteobacteria bacterium]|nr:glycerol-3-phosphate dehydrogenase/oxidase [Gammaproteobacteria bacterium]